MIQFENLDGLNAAKTQTTDNNDTEIIVEMTNLAMDDAEQLAVMIIKNDHFLTPNPEQSDWVVNSQIIGISTKNNLTFSDNQYVDVHLKSSKVELHDTIKICAYWDFSSGGWSREGCQLIGENIVDGFDTCRCRHMRIFAQLIIPDMQGISQDHLTALIFFTYFGCFVSLCGLFVIFLTAILFQHWRDEFTNKVYLNLSATFANLLLIFMINSALSINTNHNICLMFGGFLHYSILTAFSWMLIAAVLSYKKLVVVFNTDVSHKLIKISLCGWIIPLTPVILLLIINPSSYVNYHRNNTFCYPSGKGFWAAVFTPILLIVITNSVFYCVIVYKVFIKSTVLRSFDKKMIRRKVCASFLLFFLFGITWIFGLSSRILVMNYIFCITAPMQGFVLFVFFILKNSKTRNMWCEKLYLNYCIRSKCQNNSNTLKLKDCSTKTYPKPKIDTSNSFTNSYVS